MTISSSRHKGFFAIVIIILSGLILSGCTGTPNEDSVGDERVIAVINDYKMTVSDFKDETGRILAGSYFYIDSGDAKESLMKELIARKALLQEAQRQNLDKKRVFMKEIERYWEQALLKVLTDKMSGEISASLRVDDGEVISEYMNMRRRIFAELLIINDKDAAERISRAGGKFDEVKDACKENIISGFSPEWFVHRRPAAISGRSSFSLKPGQTSSAIACGDNWAVIRAVKEEEAIAPFEKVSRQIRQNILRQKKEEALEERTLGLVNSASVKVNKKILSEIELEQ